MEKLRQRLARRLRELMRDDMTMDTQTKVADRSGVSQSSVQRILAQEQAATVDVLDQLAPAFKIARPERLLLDADEVELLSVWGELTLTERSDILGYIRVVAKTRYSQHAIDEAKPVPAQLQAAQRAAATKASSAENTLKHATRASSKTAKRRST